MYVERAQERVDADRRVGVVRALDVALVPGAVEHDELHIGELAGDGHDVVGAVVGRVEVHEREALVRDEDLHAEVVGLLDDREADRGILEREPWPFGTPRRVHLERGDLTGPRGGLHLVEPRVEVTEVRGDHVVNEYSRCAAVGELAASCCVPS